MGEDKDTSFFSRWERVIRKGRKAKKESNTPTPKNDKKQPTKQECE